MKAELDKALDRLDAANMAFDLAADGSAEEYRLADAERMAAFDDYYQKAKEKAEYYKEMRLEAAADAAGCMVVAALPEKPTRAEVLGRALAECGVDCAKTRSPKWLADLFVNEICPLIVDCADCPVYPKRFTSLDCRQMAELWMNQPAEGGAE